MPTETLDQEIEYTGLALPGPWDDRYLKMAALVASFSKDPSTKCGAVIVRPDKTVCSVGFNGFPAGCSDDSELYGNRELKYSRVVHAEVNAVLHAREPLNGYTMYTWPPGYGPSCDRCTAVIIQAGIKAVVHVRGKAEFADRWRSVVEIGLDMYREAGVQVVQYDEV